MLNLSAMKSERMAKRSSFGGVVRRTLSDITNSVPQQAKALIPEKTLMPPDHSATEYTDHLVRENMALVRLVADKNKIIKLTGSELHKLRLDLQKMQINFQKLQLQNLNLAQSNSHMLAELNICRDKRKVLLHEVACKDALLKVKNEEFKKGEEPVYEQILHGNTNVQKIRRGKTRSQSMGPTTSQPVGGEAVSENKRRCLSRQSDRLRSQEQEPAENLLEIEDAQFLAGPSVDYPLAKVSLTSSIQKEEEEDENCSSKSDVFLSRRSSLGRPSRRAAEKVPSYKEVSLKVKMRR